VILGFAHPGLVVPDLERAREFYQQAFGFRVIGTEGWVDDPDLDRAIGLEGSAARGYMMAGQNCFLELWSYHAPKQSGPEPGSLGANESGIRHLAFYVDDCDAEYERLKRLGGIHLGEPVGQHGQGRAVYCRDPFGNLIELAEIRREEERLTNLPGIKD
jgi:catechol 2,3-dioxygenase-like lactoylglutathione lyase family enzyme